jgi:hypothetical protein
VSFVTPFVQSTRVAGWGYCSDQTVPPPAELIGRLEQAALSGDRAALRRNGVGLYRPEDDDCCDFFRRRQ